MKLEIERANYDSAVRAVAKGGSGEVVANNIGNAQLETIGRLGTLEDKRWRLGESLGNFAGLCGGREDN